jgi:hypothetical protein
VHVMVIEGSLRETGTRARIFAQLVDCNPGNHLWAETYERVYSSHAAFDLFDDVVPRIVSTIADTHGVLPRSMSVPTKRQKRRQPQTLRWKPKFPLLCPRPACSKSRVSLPNSLLDHAFLANPSARRTVSMLSEG